MEGYGEDGAGGVKRLDEDEARLGSVLFACAPVSVCMDDRT